MTKVRSIDRANKVMIREAASAIDGLALPIFPSHGNFLVLETVAAGIRPEALVECYRRQGIMIRQGHLSHPTLRRSLREGQHLRSVALGGKVLHTAAGDDFAGARVERFAAAILKKRV
jgi:hypothetical protein